MRCCRRRSATMLGIPGIQHRAAIALTAVNRCVRATHAICHRGFVLMLKLGKLRRTDPQATFERVSAAELANLRGLRSRQPAGLVVAARLETARLHTVAADFHVAPTSSVILARVEEEPAAGVYCAGAYAGGVWREEDI